MDYKVMLGCVAIGMALMCIPKVVGYYRHITGSGRVVYDIPGNYVVSFYFTYVGLVKVEDTTPYGRTKEELSDTLKWIDSQVSQSMDRLLSRTEYEGDIPPDEVVAKSLTDLLESLAMLSGLKLVYIKEEDNEQQQNS